MKLAALLRVILVAGALALFAAPWACGDDTSGAIDGSPADTGGGSEAGGG